MITVQLYFKNGDMLVTKTDLNFEDAKEYYIGKTFSFGFGPYTKKYECNGIDLVMSEDECSTPIFWYQGYCFSDAFWSSNNDYVNRIGQKFSVLRRATSRDVDVENLPQWEIQFEDKTKIFAYPEEIIAEEIIAAKKQLGIIKSCPIVDKLETLEAFNLLLNGEILEHKNLQYRLSENHIFEVNDKDGWRVSNMAINDFATLDFGLQGIIDNEFINNVKRQEKQPKEKTPKETLCQTKPRAIGVLIKDGEVVKLFEDDLQDILNQRTNVAVKDKARQKSETDVKYAILSKVAENCLYTGINSLMHNYGVYKGLTIRLQLDIELENSEKEIIESLLSKNESINKVWWEKDILCIHFEK